MKKTGSLSNSLTRLSRLLYLKLVRINDTPHKIALGLGVGVFCGIIPGTGPIAALTLALILRLNRAAAILGSFLTNTWLSFVTFALSLKIGAGLFGVSRRDLQQEWMLFIKGFRLINLFKLSVLKIILPIISGYFVIALCAAAIVYLGAYIIVKIYKDRKGGI